MLKVTKETDYGLVVLTCFARWQARKPILTTRFITDETGISYRMVCKILNLLTRKGFLLSHRGVKGGYGLKHRPEEISLEQAIAALDGPIALTECTKLSCDCQIEENCVLQGPWTSINEAFRHSLQGITLASILEKRTSRTPVKTGLGRAVEIK